MPKKGHTQTIKMLTVMGCSADIAGISTQSKVHDIERTSGPWLIYNIGLTAFYLVFSYGLVHLAVLRQGGHS